MTNHVPMSILKLCKFYSRNIYFLHTAILLHIYSKLGIRTVDNFPFIHSEGNLDASIPALTVQHQNNFHKRNQTGTLSQYCIFPNDNRITRLGCNRKEKEIIFIQKITS